MRKSALFYSYDMPERWKGMVGTRRKGNRTDFVLLWEEDPGCSGLLASLRCVKRRILKPDEYTELLGSLQGPDGAMHWLYVSYGQEGSVSGENEDLYWRIRDQMWQVFESIEASEGYLLERAGI